MQKISIAINHHKIYFGGLLVILLAAMFFLIVNGKEATFISPNSYHPFFLNVFFVNYTFMGDGIFAVGLIALMFFYFKRKQAGLALLYSFLISGLAVQIIKNLINRSGTTLYFEAGTYLNVTTDIPLSELSGLPSGHTATVFALCTVMVFMLKNKNQQLLILMGALLAGYSRMYLAQHFLPDVIIGAMLGTAAGILAFHLAQNRINIIRFFNKVNRVNSGTVSTPHIIQPV
ncbi:MAG: phosphatase PAP2 family protein [Ferruginibacter sp.]|nr:phosphatase PAP2 family protein [Chitinophagaceae bacterium]